MTNNEALEVIKKLRVNLISEAKSSKDIESVLNAYTLAIKALRDKVKKEKKRRWREPIKALNK